MNIQPSATSTLPDGTFQVDPAATTVTVTAKNFGFKSVPATLAVDSGAITIVDGVITAVEVAVAAGSFATGNAKRDEHVRSADFLDAETHPQLVFRCGGVDPAGSGYRATGTVIVKGAESPLAVEISDVKASASGGTFSAAATIDRKAIGVAKMPSLMIGRQLQLSVDVTATA